MSLRDAITEHVIPLLDTCKMPALVLRVGVGMFSLTAIVYNLHVYRLAEQDMTAAVRVASDRICSKGNILLLAFVIQKGFPTDVVFYLTMLPAHVCMPGCSQVSKVVMWIVRSPGPLIKTSHLLYALSARVALFRDVRRQPGETWVLAAQRITAEVRAAIVDHERRVVAEQRGVRGGGGEHQRRDERAIERRRGDGVRGLDRLFQPGLTHGVAR